ncbi:uncharacterized protein LOC120331020 isoform X2 [Styela clava]
MNKKNDEPSENNISSTTKKKRKIFNWLKKEKKKKNDPNASKGGGVGGWFEFQEECDNVLKDYWVFSGMAYRLLLPPPTTCADALRYSFTRKAYKGK